MPDLVIRAGIRRLLRAPPGRDRVERLPRRPRRGPRRSSRTCGARPSRWCRRRPTSSTTRCRRRSSAQVLGRHRKYSSCWWPQGVETLDEAEEAALCRDLRARRPRRRPAGARARLRLGLADAVDGRALSARAASPRSRTRSRSAQLHRGRGGAARPRQRAGRSRCDMNDFATRRALRPRRVGRDVRAHAQLAGALPPRARLARARAGASSCTSSCIARRLTRSIERDASDWMSRHFFSGGMMPSDDLALRFQDDLRLAAALALGRHALRAHRQRLARKPGRAARRGAGRSSSRPTAREPPRLWWMRWRIFFMACAELFGYDDGQQWWVSHYLFERVAMMACAATRTAAGARGGESRCSS